MKTLARYQFGLSLLGLLVVGLLGIVLMQAGDAKQDNKTYKAADDIAIKLEDYINDKQQVPETLAEAKVKDVPSTISYKKLSDESYKFCATYQSKSAGFADTSTVVEDAVYQGMTGSASPTDGLTDDTYANSDDNGYLYISPDHKKGDNCQTITPYIYQTSSDDGTGLGDVSDPKKASVAAGKLDAVCYESSYTSHYSGVVTSVVTAGSRPVVAESAQDIVIKVAPDAGSTVAGEQTVSSQAYVVLSNTCSDISPQSVKVGDFVAVFNNEASQYSAKTMIDFSRDQ